MRPAAATACWAAVEREWSEARRRAKRDRRPRFRAGRWLRNAQRSARRWRMKGELSAGSLGSRTGPLQSAQRCGLSQGDISQLLGDRKRRRAESGLRARSCLPTPPVATTATEAEQPARSCSRRARRRCRARLNAIKMPARATKTGASKFRFGFCLPNVPPLSSGRIRKPDGYRWQRASPWYLTTGDRGAVMHATRCGRLLQRLVGRRAHRVARSFRQAS